MGGPHCHESDDELESKSGPNHALDSTADLGSDGASTGTVGENGAYQSSHMEPDCAHTPGEKGTHGCPHHDNSSLSSAREEGKDAVDSKKEDQDI